MASWEKDRIVVVSRGPEPLVFARGQDTLQHFPVPHQDTSVLDSVGCGDALSGVFMARLALTGDPEQALREGITTATEIARTSGRGPPTGTLEELLRRQNDPVRP